jgi:hypothetical protein
MELQDYTLVALLVLLAIWAFYVRDTNIVPGGGETAGHSSSSHGKRVDAKQQQLNPALPATLAAAMAASVDAVIPAKLIGAPAVVTDSDPEESMELARAVVNRVNAVAQVGSVHLSLTNVDSVAKTSDAYKTVFYDIVFNAYEVVTNVGVRIFASLVIPATKAGTMYVRELRTADMGLDGPVDAGDGTCIDASFAPWEATLQ